MTIRHLLERIAVQECVAAGGACLVLVAAAASAGKPGGGDLVARIGQTVVTRDDFERQFGRQPLPPEASADSARQAFLESLIHKELLVLEARERGLFGPVPEIDNQVQAYGEDLLLARMREEEGRIDSTVTEEEVVAAFAESQDEILMRHILHWSSSALDSARQRIAAGTPFDSVAAEISLDRRSGEQGGLLPWLNSRQLIREFLAAIDTVAVGSMAGPFGSPYGWHLVRIEERRKREGADLALERDKVREDILMRRDREKRLDAAAAYLERHRFEMDEEAVLATEREAEEAFRTALADSLKRYGSIVANWVPQDSTRVLARYEGGTITVEDYRQNLGAGGSAYLWRRLTPNGAISDVREILYRWARLRAAKHLGYDQDAEWQRRVNLKREELAVDRLYREVVLAGASPAEEEKHAYFESHADEFVQAERFRYAYMQVDDASVAEGLVPEMAGIEAARFDSLSASIQATGHLLAAVRDSGRREANACGAVAGAALTMQPGEVGHVVEADGTHTVFVLISHEPEAPETYDQAQGRVERTLMNLRTEERLSRLLKDLEAKFGVERHPERVLGTG